MNHNFSEWLAYAMEERGFTPTKLAETAGISRGSIYNLLKGRRGLGPEAGTALARALDLPSDLVFERAGLMPPKGDRDERLEQLATIFQNLDRRHQAMLLSYAQFLSETQYVPILWELMDKFSDPKPDGVLMIVHDPKQIEDLVKDGGRKVEILAYVSEEGYLIKVIDLEEFKDIEGLT